MFNPARHNNVHLNPSIQGAEEGNAIQVQGQSDLYGEF